MDFDDAIDIIRDSLGGTPDRYLVAADGSLHTDRAAAEQRLRTCMTNQFDQERTCPTVKLKWRRPAVGPKITNGAGTRPATAPLCSSMADPRTTDFISAASAANPCNPNP